MSSFTAKYRNIKTNEICTVIAIDDYFGSRDYGYRVDNKNHTYREKDFIKLYERVLPESTD